MGAALGTIGEATIGVPRPPRYRDRVAVPRGSMPRLHLISFDLCPFVQRSTIALHEKGAAFDLDYVDLKAKPDWFLKLSPHGRVPVLVVDDTPLFESLVILEYLDETLSPRLHPVDALERARDRAWFSVADALNAAAYQMMVAPDDDRLHQHATVARQHLARLEEQLVGPLWRGEHFCAMDAVAYPALQRLHWFSELYPALELFARTPKVAAWERALRDRPSIQASTVPDIQQRFLTALPTYGAVHRPQSTPQP